MGTGGGGYGTNSKSSGHGAKSRGTNEKNGTTEKFLLSVNRLILYF
jgi:hypothetical protein